MRRTTTTTAAGAALAAALILAGCSNGGDGDAAEDGPEADTGGDPYVEGDQGVDEAEEEQFTDLPVGDPFGEASWGVDNLDTDALSSPIVTSTHVIGVQDRELRAWDAQGQEAWSVPLPEDESEPGRDDGLEVRQTSPETVAVVTFGEVEGDGLDVDTFGASVILIDTTDGSVVTETEVPGDEHNPPELSSVGLGFVIPGGGGGLAITPDGQEHDDLDFATQGNLPGDNDIDPAIGTVGETVFWATDQREEDYGYETDTWSTDGLHDEYTISSHFQGHSHHGVLIIGQGADDTYAVEAETGEVIDALDCRPGDDAMTSSPSGEWGVSGGLRLGDGGHECIGGEGQQGVGLSAVTDDGTAYGTSEDSLVVVPPEGEEEVTDLPEDADAPIAVLEGNLAVHWDDGTVNVNPVE